MKLKKELKESWASLPNAPKSNGNLAKELSNLKVDIKKLEEKEAKVK